MGKSKKKSRQAVEHSAVMDSQEPAAVGWGLGIYLGLLALLVSALAYLHFPNGIDLGRKLIDYDDLEVVSKMMDLDLKSYLTQWLPNRIHYAFPLRDATIFLDRWLLPQSQGQFWISNFVFFAMSLSFVTLIIRRLFGSYRILPLALIVVFALHPLQTEVIQWITCRKYLVGLVPVVWGTWLAVLWRGQQLGKWRVAALCSLWGLSIAAYPTAVFWIFWVTFFVTRENPFKKSLKLNAFYAVVAVTYLYLVGHGTGEVNSSLGSIVSAYGKSFHFGYNALGRGFFNLVFPYWTFPYYRENHVLSFVGLFLLAVFLFAIWRFSRLAFGASAKPKVREYMREAILWFLGGCVFIIPIANTILGFFDFMLADRHFFFSMPFFVVALGYLVLAVRESLSTVRAGLVGIVIVALSGWLVFCVHSISQKVPLWESDFILMRDCVANEKSARCMSQTIRRRFFKSDCSGVKDVIMQAAEYYRDHPPYAFEYISEIPFYHSTCVALNVSTPVVQKISIIESLDHYYGQSPDILFGLTLAALENGMIDKAFDYASQYYLSDLSMGPIAATRTLQSVYAGQIAALCTLKPSPLCSARLKRFLSIHADANPNTGSGAWGRDATLLMARRGKLL